MVLLLSLVCVLILYWLFRPETYRPSTEPTNTTDQTIPSDLPTGRTVFINRQAGELDRMEMFYRVAGNPENPPVILIHGISGNSGTTWYNTYSDLSQDYYVLGVDLRGHGLTAQPPEDYSIEMMADDVGAFMSELDIEHAHVVAHSMGGLVAMQLAHAYPDEVHSLVLLDTAATWNQDWYGVVFPLYPYLVRLKNRTVGWEQENRDRAKAFTRFEVSPEFQDWIYQQRDINQIEPFIASWRAIHGFSAIDFLPDLNQPTLIVYGEDDDLVPPHFRQQLNDLIADSEMTIIPSPARHYPHIQFSEQVNPAIIEFLNTHPIDKE